MIKRVEVNGQGYDCSVESGRLVSIHKEMPVQAWLALGSEDARRLYTVSKLSGLWLRIAAILAEQRRL